MLEILRDKRLLIFDLDGTVADTESLHWEAYNILLEKQGTHLDEADILRYIGRPEREIYADIERDKGIKINVDEFLTARTALYLRLTEERGLQPYKYFKELLALNGKGVLPPAILLSAQMPYVADAVIKRLGADGFFPDDLRFFAHNGKITKRGVLADINAYIGFGEDGKVFSKNPYTRFDAVSISFREALKGAHASSALSGSDGIKNFANEIKNSEAVLFEDAPSVLEFAVANGFYTVGVEHSLNVGKIKADVKLTYIL
ncbi:MAG: HAD family phosphatase [Clostridiaceae bacterium]|jgi:beta-phosphoglucomutase-like phosphatase (HAD superfamily)|nr:HAD family phosphatase [Clostridiaceae bacterium]